jgi:hypothetical protein
MILIGPDLAWRALITVGPCEVGFIWEGASAPIIRRNMRVRRKINIAGILGVLVVLLAPLAAPMRLQAGPMPLSYFKFDEAFDEGVLKNEISGAPDAVFREGTAVLTDSDSDPTLVIGKFGKAISFDGVNDYLDLSIDGHPNQDGGIPVGSVTFWIRTTTTEQFTAAGNLNLKDAMGWQLHGNTIVDSKNTGHFTFFVRSPDDKTYRWFIDRGSTWQNGHWNHIAVSWDANNNQGAMYINAQSYELKSELKRGDPDNTFTDWQYPMVLGARDKNGTVSNHMQADIDDFRVYGVQLTQNEVYEVMTGPLTLLSSAIPEPGGLGLFGMALLALRKRRT